MGPAYLALLSNDNMVDWKVLAQSVSHGTTTSYWCHGDESKGSLRLLKIEKV